MRNKSHHSKAQAVDPLCANKREDDGIPPSVLAKRKQQEHRHVNYHGEQLCKQIRIAIGEALACDCADPTLSDLQVIEVNMLSGTSALEVIVTGRHLNLKQLQETQQRLQASEGQVRASIADSVNRKRLPRLKFRVAPSE